MYVLNVYINTIYIMYKHIYIYIYVNIYTLYISRRTTHIHKFIFTYIYILIHIYIYTPVIYLMEKSAGGIILTLVLRRAQNTPIYISYYYY